MSRIIHNSSEREGVAIRIVHIRIVVVIAIAIGIVILILIVVIIVNVVVGLMIDITVIGMVSVVGMVEFRRDEGRR